MNDELKAARLSVHGAGGAIDFGLLESVEALTAGPQKHTSTGREE
jgi:hypothetical protein